MNSKLGKVARGTPSGQRRTPHGTVLALSGLLAFGCNAGVLTANDPESAGDPSNQGGAGNLSGTGGAGGTGGSTSGVGGSNTGGAVEVPPLANPDFLPTRIRRLSNTEYSNSVAELLGEDFDVAEGFAPDARQGGFTVNDAQRVDPVLAKQLYAVSDTVSEAIQGRLTELAPCDTPNDELACAAAFIERFAGQAYRRPLNDEERTGLLAVYEVGAADEGYAAGIALVIRTVLQSAGFLYVTELGNGVAADDGTVTLGPYELASALSYLATGAAPDAALLADAEAGLLNTPEGRVAALQRMAGTPENLDRMVQLVREWLELDQIESTAKDTNIYPAYPGLQAVIAAESYAFVRAVLDPANGYADHVTTLLSADWTVGDQNLAQLYTNATDLGDGRLSLPARRGVLNQGAFLAVQAHAHESTPVLRGVVITRRLLCMNIPAPNSLNIDVVPPVPDPTQTTRQRFEVHTTDDACASCHKVIDGFGNAFEQFDGMGQHRTTENNLPVDPTTTVTISTALDGYYENSNTLAEALATDPGVRECFARQVFRSVMGRSDAQAADAEEVFITAYRSLPMVSQGNLFTLLETVVANPLFAQRSVYE